jgi:hypothetical protein
MEIWSVHLACAYALGSLFICLMKSAANSWWFHGHNFRAKFSGIIFTCCLPNLDVYTSTVLYCYEQHVLVAFYLTFCKNISLHFLSSIQDVIYLQHCGGYNKHKYYSYRRVRVWHTDSWAKDELYYIEAGSRKRNQHYSLCTSYQKRVLLVLKLLGCVPMFADARHTRRSSAADDRFRQRRILDLFSEHETCMEPASQLRNWGVDSPSKIRLASKREIIQNTCFLWWLLFFANIFVMFSLGLVPIPIAILLSCITRAGIMLHTCIC